jgi:cytochrome oxidase assembly protein ShyY1
MSDVGAVPEHSGTVTFGAVARRPRWIGMLLLSLLVAAVLGGLAQWQLSRAVEDGTRAPIDTENVVPLESVQQPQSPTMEASSGHRVVARFDDGASGATLAVAVGWTESLDAARDWTQPAAMTSDHSTTIEGRYLIGEAPSNENTDTSVLTTMSPAALVNVWADFAGQEVYGGYLILDDAPSGLATIEVPTQQEQIELNWLNLFYAIEWVLFAAGAIYLWYRLVKDQMERENEEAADRAVIDAHVE